MMDQSTFFKDLLVVELASVLAGPAVGLFFAELGARVIKIENKKTAGDVTRSWKLPQEDPNDPLSAYYHHVNWHKEAHLMDLQAEKDRQQALGWIQKADVVISNFKAGSAAKMGMDYESLSTLNPKLIYACISAYGEDNPKPGFDTMIQAETGWVYMNGHPDGGPVKLPVALVDVLAAHQLKQGILLALLQRSSIGKGSKVHVSLYDSGISALANQASNWLNLGKLPQRSGNQHPNIAPYGDIFYSKENKPILVSTGTQKQFAYLCKCLDIPYLPEDPRFSTNPLRLKNRPSLNENLEAAFRQLPFDEIFQRCEALGVPIAPINNLQDLFEQPEAQRLVLEEEHEDGKVSKRVRTVVFDVE